MPKFSESFIVESSFRLPGLGLLALPQAPEPSWLTTYDLHTAFTVVLPACIQPPPSVIGTLEEISHTDLATCRGLLLDFNPDTPLLIDTHLQVSERPLDLY